MIFLILPHQLFEKKHLPKNIKEVVIWEHPHYFTQYQYNKKKLLLHRASMKQYHQYLKSSYKCRYVEFQTTLKLTTYTMFDPIDIIKLPNKPIMLESPGFLLTKDHYQQYRKKTSKFFFNAFYMWGKKVLNVMPKVKSLDKMNRHKLAKTIKLNPLPRLSTKLTPHIQYVEKNCHFLPQ